MFEGLVQPHVEEPRAGEGQGQRCEPLRQGYRVYSLEFRVQDRIVGFSEEVRRQLSELLPLVVLQTQVKTPWSFFAY